MSASPQQEQEQQQQRRLRAALSRGVHVVLKDGIGRGVWATTPPASTTTTTGALKARERPELEIRIGRLRANGHFQPGVAGLSMLDRVFERFVCASTNNPMTDATALRCSTGTANSNKSMAVVVEPRAEPELLALTPLSHTERVEKTEHGPSIVRVKRVLAPETDVAGAVEKWCFDVRVALSAESARAPEQHECDAPHMTIRARRSVRMCATNPWRLDFTARLDDMAEDVMLTDIELEYAPTEEVLQQTRVALQKHPQQQWEPALASIVHAHVEQALIQLRMISAALRHFLNL
jgi:hypothetical protein